MSYFVSNFSYSVDEFNSLTPVQAYQILGQKSEIEFNRLLFLMREFRSINWHTVVATAGSSKIKRPQDLYTLPGDKEEKTLTQKQLEFFNRPLTAQERKVLGLN